MAKVNRVCMVAKSLKSFLFVLLVFISHHKLLGTSVLWVLPACLKEVGSICFQHLFPLSARPAGSIKNSLSS